MNNKYIQTLPGRVRLRIPQSKAGGDSHGTKLQVTMATRISPRHRDHSGSIKSSTKGTNAVLFSGEKKINQKQKIRKKKRGRFSTY